MVFLNRRRTRERADRALAGKSTQGPARTGASPEAQYQLALELKGLGRPAEAIGPLRIAQTSSNSLVAEAATFELGRCLHHTGQLSEAEENFRRAAMSSNPDILAPASFALGIMLESKGQD